MHGLAGLREIYTGRGDQKGAARIGTHIDQLTDILVKIRGVGGGTESIKGGLKGFGPLAKFRISPEEFQQRAFRKLQANELVERFKTEGVASSGPRVSPFDPRSLLAVINSRSREKFEKSGEYKELIRIQKDANKIQEKSLLDSKTILKGSVAIATFEAFNKKHSSQVLDTLKEQLVTEEAKLSNAGPGSNIPEMQKNIESLNKAIADQEKNLQFHGLVASMTQVSSITTILGKTLGVSETNLKRMNVGAIGLYAAMQAASKVTGKDMPDSAKEFGGVLKDAVGELKEGGDFKDIGLKLRNAGKKFEEAYGERVKEATGKTKEAISKQINERLKGMKNLSEAEINERAKQLRKQASGKGGAGIGALIAALSAATIAGTAYELSGSGTANAELERIAERTSDVFNRIIEKYPEAADLIAQELVKQVQEQSQAEKRLNRL